MAVHFLHIRKTGGSAIKYALSRAGSTDTPFGPLVVHRHNFGLADVPPEDFCWFVLRDPVARFVSGFNSRLRQGRPLNDVPWSVKERAAFDRYRTPGELADALARRDVAAYAAINDIRHLKYPLGDWLVNAALVHEKRHQIVFAARQETLRSDWDSLRRLLALPLICRLPIDPVVANRSSTEYPRELSDEGRGAVRRWYKEDYEILEAADSIRYARIMWLNTRQ